MSKRCIGSFRCVYTDVADWTAVRHVLILFNREKTDALISLNQSLQDDSLYNREPWTHELQSFSICRFDVIFDDLDITFEIDDVLLFYLLFSSFSWIIDAIWRHVTKIGLTLLIGADCYRGASWRWKYFCCGKPDSDFLSLVCWHLWRLSRAIYKLLAVKKSAFDLRYTHQCHCESKRLCSDNG